MTQNETARELRTSRANVSMIEHRARKKIELARQTLREYQSTLTDHEVRIAKGMRVYDIPPMVLRAGDGAGIHIRANIVDMMRMVKEIRPRCVDRGRTSKAVLLVFNQRGRLKVGRASGGRG